ncbi:MAG: ClpP-like prohead protease/major capsid protein fusion protein [Rhodanobacter sp.]
MRNTVLSAAIALAMAAPVPGLFAAFAAADGNLPTIRPLMLLRPVADTTEAELLVYGDIGDSWYGESVTALGVVQQLAALDPGTTQINVRINSYGGSVSDGIAIYNVLKRSSAKKVVTIDGVAMSSASLIAMAGDEIQVSATSLMMVHAPWGFSQGNAQDMRLAADTLDIYATAMAAAYAAKTGETSAAMLALLNDGTDHYYAGNDAVTAGFADVLIDDQPDEGDDTATENASAMGAGVSRLVARAPENIRQMAIAAAARHPRALPQAAKPHLTAAQLAQLSTRTPAAAAATTGVITMPQAVTTTAPQAEPAASAAAITAQAYAALRERNAEIKAVLEPYMKREGVSALYVEALADPSATADTVRAKLLPILGAGSEPAGTSMHIEMGTSEAEKTRGAAEQMLLARYNVIKGADADRARQGNPFASSTISGIAERFLIQAGVNTRSMGREEIARRVLAAQTTSDFPVLLENVLHKVLIGGYNASPFTWTRFCATGTLMDYRPHGRYHLSSFSDLLPVNEHGEYPNGVLGDAAKETITGSRKGRILEITPEAIVNDDLGGLVRVAAALGQAAGRTIEKDVFALFGMNSGNGPTMSDGNPLFHSAHGNIAATAAAPSVASFDAARQAMANQKDPAGNDFLDITPSIWLGPLSLGGNARVINRSEYDPDATSKLQRPNMVANMFADIVDSPRLSGTGWYALAAPGTEPVFEVAFLDGVQTPTLEQELNFRTDGIAWKAAHRYGVGAVGWRGINKNAGA